jgi:phosphopantetheinyl transferase
MFGWGVGATITFLLTARELPRDGQRALVEAWLAKGGVTLTRMCPHCGGSDHGRPRTADRQLSLAYADGLVTLAVADVPIGVDAELSGPAPAPFADRQEWTRAEAILKLTGEGVRRDPASVDPGEAWTTELPAPPGYVATLAARAEVEVSCRTGTVAELDPPATAPAGP